MPFIKRNIHLVLPITITVLTMVAAPAQSQAQQGTSTTSPSPQASPSTTTGAQAPQSNPAAQPGTQQPTPAPAASPGAQSSPSPNIQTSANQQAANASSGTVIPAGTLITITPTQPIQNAQVGSTYPAQISQNVVGSDGKVLIPSGTTAQLTVNNAVSPTGAQEMALALKSITLNGRTLNVSTNQGQSGAQSSGATSSQSGSASSSQGGLLGTLVHVLDNKESQQQGNAAQSGGVLSSVLGQILTHGSTVNVPSQSQLTFRLDQPLQLQ